jgi:dephospho-CoA kinase
MAQDADGTELVLLPGERVVVSFRPSPWMIILGNGGWYLLMVLVLVAAWSGGKTFLADLWGILLGLWTMAVAARLLWDLLTWWFRRYTLTDRRIAVQGGVVQRSVIDLPLENVQYLAMDASVRQRVVGLGSIGAGTSGWGVAELLWLYVADPGVKMGQIREEIERAKNGRGGTMSVARAARANVHVIGLVGGIGSGKSTVAEELEMLGCVVVDSDRSAREILTRPEIKGILTGWWGAGILDGDGNVDRREVARIVFAEPAERERLEGVVHPLIRQERDELIDRIGEAGGGVVVVDAPLLFEAGVDKECEAVVFVDAPREVRAARVSRRGWDAQELGRREAAQMPLDEKKRRSTYVVVNDGTREELHERVVEMVEGWRKAWGMGEKRG